ncbi:MAG: hypothetical protein ABW217_00895, partial [Polyangiaceae bacterium]
RAARELLRALRGRRTKPAFSRHLGYKSNVAQRWESGVSWPTATSFFDICQRLRIDLRAAVSRYLRRDPSWLSQPGLRSAEGVASFLSDLRGRTPINVLASASGYNRYSISRWLKSSAVPRLPELLCLIEVCTRRLVDFVAELVDPEQMPSLASEWRALRLAREGMFSRPGSHAVLRALDLAAPRGAGRQVAQLSRKTGLPVEQVEQELEFLVSTSQVVKTRSGYRAHGHAVVDTGGQAERALELKLTWSEFAIARLRARAPGHIGYSLFSVSRANMVKIRHLQLEYVRALSAIIASPEPSECVGLYCAQLLDLALPEDNVFAGHELPVAAKVRAT